MRIDLDKKVYSSRQETDSYIYGSADVVGLMCLCVFCGDNKKLFEELKIPAMRLCSAFQKVNFLRDLQQDVNELGRVYFPGFSFEEFDEKVKKELVNNIQQKIRHAEMLFQELNNSNIEVKFETRFKAEDITEIIRRHL